MGDVNHFGDFLKNMRLRLGLSLRDFCVRNGLDPGNYSRLERGRFRPPESREQLEKYARALELEPGSDEWLEMFDLAAAQRGVFPEDLLADEDVVSKLPVLFRTLRANQVSSEKLDEFIEKIRRS
ncbi:MAG: helix-turn-helix domain-containing protein [Planctomycetota bacterium]